MNAAVIAPDALPASHATEKIKNKILYASNL